MRRLVLLAVPAAWMVACSESGFVANTDPEAPPEVEVDSGADPDVQVDAPDLVLSPAALDLGEVGVGCAASGTVSLTNAGTADLHVEGLSFEGDAAWTLADGNVWPLTLAPGASTTVSVSLVPTAQGEVAASLVAVSDDPDGDEVATQVGAGVLGPRGEDTFDVPENPPVDILFAVDQSCSMDSHAANLGANFGSLAAELSAVTNNWRVGVVTQQSACFNNGVLSPTTPGLAAKFTDAVQAGGNDVPDTERLFSLTLGALNQTSGNACNAGFLRPSALLHVVFVSDEWEQSGDIGNAGSRALQWVDTATTFKGDPALLRASGVICPESGCDWAGSDGRPDGYREAVADTAGARLDISTSNWGAAAAQIAEASLEGLYDFPLSATPDVSTLKVWVNGVQWTSGWSYDAGGNLVRFDSELGGGQVVAKYNRVATCG